MPDREASNNLSSAFAVRGNDALESQYDEWAETYDADNAAMGFRLPVLATAFFARWVPTGGKALDAGCGTGLASENLHILGYRDLVGIDLSNAMLNKARETGVFSELYRMVMGEALDFASDTFSGAIVTGVFTEGHAPHSSFDELIRVVRRGGHIVFNVRDDIYEHHGFREKMDRLESDGLWKLSEKSEAFRPFTISEPHVIARIFAYEVTS
ncbi:biotin biosynthesis protein BioC [Ruegeria denitrificans]|uniref:Biotin biosynthesis protein BioC n=1 Tax=Ruegeria denitrificans TaxID=1715692 RepID=A0A0P1I0W0_9RHOB|nr:class I SAM-dependent methyltransferase [Ruegeria denitrificans]CUJ83625.1 biotin biosynthesis protein BioC [Ruegeria denitrificans]